MRRNHSVLSVALAVVVPVGSMLLAVGCSKTEEATDSADGRMAGRPGGPAGEGGGDSFQPVAANATAPEIFQQKCQSCHGNEGQGARGPALTKAALKNSADLRQTIHDGQRKMPAFATQLSKAQIDAMVAYVKQLGKTR